MDEIDQQLLTITQQGIPLTSTPYHDLGQQIGIDGEEIIERLKKLKNNGYIRRIGGIFSSKRLGYISTLVAMEVSEDRFYEVAKIINSYLGVTHNYRRNHSYNLWFTLIAPSQQRLAVILKEIKEKTGITRMIELPAERFFKLAVKLELDNRGD
ncbi:AsnC family transcriptional regulator [Orenia metallireducens]|jgi:DNA-binding Lrp family transcriptional regulator|uniref:siroheme decarboxylase n=1 Tax=Orenia metallireducens TaxID=1413210 RepID=A0A285GSD9_9FIRM|nr:AsnC family transcriptional regulator [Orenia metallireducens]PRX29873.1 AsnC family transcriptional regulator [Orenia metallireducens]SNY25426.1 transcriptional regulator, AsnC family [Orenia metallireducens]